MRLLHENIFSSQRSLSLLLCLLVVCLTSAQDTATQTVGEDADSSSISIDQADTNYEHQNYFNLKGSFVDTIELRQVPARIIDSLKNDDAFWYADHVFEKKKPKRKNFSAEKPPLQWINMTTLLVIVVLFLGILAWYLLQNNIVGSRQSIIAEKGDEDITSENIFSINYQKEIERAVSAADYRLATRLLFLRLLKQLSEKRIIDYKQERTNFDYLSQLRATAYYNDFFRLTRNYEYTWYGKFDLSREMFSIIKNEFETFDRKMS